MLTRKHSNKMHTTHLETISASSFSGYHQMPLWRVGPQMNMF